VSYAIDKGVLMSTFRVTVNHLFHVIS